MSVARRHIHGIYEQNRRKGFRLIRCAVAGCNITAFVHRRALAGIPCPWRCGMHLVMGIRA